VPEEHDNVKFVLLINGKKPFHLDLCTPDHLTTYTVPLPSSTVPHPGSHTPVMPCSSKENFLIDHQMMLRSVLLSTTSNVSLSCKNRI
jgi:hypothetical protein